MHLLNISQLTFILGESYYKLPFQTMISFRVRNKKSRKCCSSSFRNQSNSSSPKKTNQYVIRVTRDFSLSLKRVNFSWKTFYGIIKVPTDLTTKKLPAINGGGSISNLSILIRLFPIHFVSKPMFIRRLLKNKNVRLLESGYLLFEKKPLASPLDLVAANLRISKGFTVVPKQSKDFLPIARRLVFNLRRKLRRHRKKHLGIINANRNLDTPYTDIGPLIDAIKFKLDGSIRMSRSERKRQNKRKIKKALEYKILREANRTKKILDEKNKLKEKQKKVRKRFHAAVALAYLNQLKLLERNYINESPEKHLDRLFSSVDLQEKIISMKKKFFPG
jgi:hypothetical protein